MHQHRHLAHWLMAAVLLIGQCLAIAHAAEHLSLPPGAHICSICVNASTGGGIPSAPTLSLDQPIRQEAPCAALISIPVGPRKAGDPIRGPPTLLT